MMIERMTRLRFMYRFPVALLVLLGFAYVVQLMSSYSDDTITVTNTAFVIMATLAGLSFSFARVIESDVLTSRVTFAGERLLHGGILVPVASLLKYAAFNLVSIPFVANIPHARTSVLLTAGIVGSTFFFAGVLIAHRGLRVLNDLLISRMTREKSDAIAKPEIR
jgi:hypothetical protein